MRNKEVITRDIHVMSHTVDGFTLSYIADNNRYYKQRYIGYGLQEANMRFKEYILEEMYREEEVIQSLRYVDGTRLDKARVLLARPL